MRATTITFPITSNLQIRSIRLKISQATHLQPFAALQLIQTVGKTKDKWKKVFNLATSIPQSSWTRKECVKLTSKMFKWIKFTCWSVKMSHLRSENQHQISLKMNGTPLKQQVTGISTHLWVIETWLDGFQLTRRKISQWWHFHQREKASFCHKLVEAT